MTVQTFKNLPLRKIVLGLSFSLILSANASVFSDLNTLAYRGDRDAQYDLATMYMEGKGVEKDAVKAFEWYQKAAKQGDVDAQFIVGVLYAEGEGVQKNYAKAMEWYLKAANQGDSDGVVCGRGRNPTLRLWPAIFSGEIDVFPSERRNMGQEIGR